MLYKESESYRTRKRDGEKLNIAMLGHKRIPSREGGIEIVVEELSTRMAALNHNVTCYNRNGNNINGTKFNSPSDSGVYKGVILKRVPTINKKGLAAVTSSVSGAFAAAFGKYDVVHFHAEGPSFMCWFTKLFRKKIIVTIHGLDHQRAKWGRLASKYIMMGEKSAVKYADEIIVLSEHMQKYFEDTYGRKTNLIPNGVTRPEYRECKMIKEKFGLEKEGYFLFLGRIVPEKGLRRLIEAFQQLRTDKKLVIAGGSSDTDTFLHELQDMADTDVRIIFTGFVQGAVLEELYSNAYVYVLPSDLEGMPLSLLEAMSYGYCCVVSDISECTEVVEDKAVIFKKGIASDLQEKLQELCDDMELVGRYKRKAADFICEKYSWDDVVKRTLDLYKGDIK